MPRLIISVMSFLHSRSEELGGWVGPLRRSTMKTAARRIIGATRHSSSTTTAKNGGSSSGWRTDRPPRRRPPPEHPGRGLLAWPGRDGTGVPLSQQVVPVSLNVIEKFPVDPSDETESR